MRTKNREQVESRRYRRKRKVRVWPVTSCCSTNQDIETGDLLVDARGRLYRAEECSRSHAGELYPRLIRPPTPEMRAVVRDGEVWWE
jgi:hypothetical protein